MKRFATLVVFVILGIFTTASGNDMRGKMAVGGFLGYDFGIGSNFDDEVFGDTTLETSLGFSFGGQFQYGITSNIALATQFNYVVMNFKYSGVDDAELVDPNNESILSINLNGMYFFRGESKFNPYVETGPGFYIPSEEDADSKFGLNAGVGFLYFFQESVAFEFGGNYHLIFDKDDDLGKDNTSYINIHAGLKFFTGGN